jgi:DNA ligase (NAD+)
VYENNRLVRAATRGDGERGEEITENAKQVKHILHQVDFSKHHIKKIELRGEVVIEKNKFDAMNIIREEAGLAIFQNPRNTASGSLRLKDASEVKHRNLEAFIYNIGYVEFDDELNSSFEKTQSDNIELLHSIGFQSASCIGKRCATIQEVIKFCNEWETKRPSYPYEIDGMVVKLNRISQQMNLGATSHHPKWAIAYKFKAIEKPTTLLEIDFQVGRTGIVTPVAKVEPVNVGGVTVRSISLHNEDNIKSKDIRIGDTVFIERAGDVIPQITRVDYSKRLNQIPFEYIKNCPKCQFELIRNEGEAAWRCVSDACPAQKLEKIIYFVSKDAMNIKGLGKDIVKRFVEEGLIQDILDVFRLDYEKILSLEGWKEQSVDNLKNSIAESKNNELYRLIVALGIDNVGNTMSKTLAKKVSHLLEFQSWSLEDFNNLDDIGPKMAQSLYSFFQNPNQIELLTQLEALGVNLKGATQNLEGKLLGKIIVFTGFRNPELEVKIEREGGEVANSLSKKTNILIMKEKGSGSSKEKKAMENGTEIYTVEEFESAFF